MLSPTSEDQFLVLKMIQEEDFPIPLPLERARKILLDAGHILQGPSGDHLSATGHQLLLLVRQSQQIDA